MDSAVHSPSLPRTAGGRPGMLPHLASYKAQIAQPAMTGRRWTRAKVIKGGDDELGSKSATMGSQHLSSSSSMMYGDAVPPSELSTTMFQT